MLTVYLWVNAALYAVFGVLCLVRFDATARALGYSVLTAAGRSEYGVVYGGMQIGLAIFFAITALGDRTMQRSGLYLALALYVPIVIMRLSTLLLFHVTESTTLTVAALEIALALAALLLALWR